MKNIIENKVFIYSPQEGIITIKNIDVKKQDLLKELKISKILIENIKIVTFVNEIAIINSRLFEGFDNIEKIIFSKEIKEINAEAFRNCKNLKKVYFLCDNFELKRAIDIFKGCQNVTFYTQNQELNENLIAHEKYIGTNNSIFKPISTG